MKFLCGNCCLCNFKIIFISFSGKDTKRHGYLQFLNHTRLKDPEITDFVDSMKIVVFMAMFSKVGSHDSAVAIDQLAQLRPERIIPPLLEKSVCVFKQLR